jgi:hypothetical protein
LMSVYSYDLLRASSINLQYHHHIWEVTTYHYSFQQQLLNRLVRISTQQQAMITKGRNNTQRSRFQSQTRDLETLNQAQYFIFKVGQGSHNFEMLLFRLLNLQ